VFSMSKGRTRLVAEGPGKRALFVFMGFHFRLSLSEASTGMASAGLRGSLLICRDWVLPIGRPISITAGAGCHVVISKPSTPGVRNFHLVVHDIGGLSVLMSFGAFR